MSAKIMTIDDRQLSKLSKYHVACLTALSYSLRVDNLTKLIKELTTHFYLYNQKTGRSYIYGEWSVRRKCCVNNKLHVSKFLGGDFPDQHFTNKEKVLNFCATNPTKPC